LYGDVVSNIAMYELLDWQLHMDILVVMSFLGNKWFI